MNESNRVNLFTGKLIKTIEISDAGLKRIAAALRELPPLECEAENSEILDNCMDIINQERKPTKNKSGSNAIACGDVRNKRDDMELEKLYRVNGVSDLMEFAKTL